MEHLISLSLAEMREGLLAGRFSSGDLVRAHLDRIKQTNDALNSFALIAEDQALKAAELADQQLKTAGAKSAFFTGIPVSIKDMLVTKGIESTCASKILKGFIPPYDCTAVAKLKDAGAIILGKTNQDEFGMGSSNENSNFGPARNPWDLERVPGGSSGGSAVSVAVGQCPASLGTDTGGSIRQPACLTGVVGLRTTYGRVSRYGAVAYASSLDQIGPFARSVEDIAITLGVIAGADDKDSTSMKVPVPDYAAELKAFRGTDLKGLRIGVPKEYFVSGMDHEVETAVKESLRIFTDLGAEVVEISLPHTEYALSVYYILATAEASSNLARYDGVRYGLRSHGSGDLQEMYEYTRAEGFGPEVRRRILMGTYVLSAGYYDAYYLKAQQVRTLIINDFKAAFTNRCDVIVAPVSPTTAFKLGEKSDSPLQMYLADIFTIPVNLAGLPGLAVPYRLDSKGLPIGIQLIGPAFGEPVLLRAGQAFEAAVNFSSEQLRRDSYARV